MLKSSYLASLLAVASALYTLGCKNEVEAVVPDGTSSGSGGSVGSGGSGGSGAGGSTGSAACDTVVADASTTPTVILQGKAGTIAVDDCWLFLGGADSPVPYRVSKAGGTPELVIPADGIPGSSVNLIALDATHIYWVTFVGAGSNQYGLWSAPKAGGTPVQLPNEAGPNSSAPGEITVDDSYVYLTYPDFYNTNNGIDQLNGVVRRVPKAGGPAEDIASVFTYSLAADSSHVYWPRRALDGSGELIKAGKDGSGATAFIKEIGPIGVVATRGSRLFWTFEDAGFSNLRTVDGAGTPSTLVTTKDYFGTPAVTADAVYWLRPGQADTGAVLRATLDGTVTEVAKAPASANYSGFYGTFGTRIAADAQAVYWTYDGGSGAARVYRVAR